MIYTYHNLQEAVPRKQLVKEIYNRAVGLQTSSQIQQMLKDFIDLAQEVSPMQAKDARGCSVYYRWQSDPAIGAHPAPSRSGWYQSTALRDDPWHPVDTVAHVPLDIQTYYLTSLQRKL